VDQLTHETSSSTGADPTGKKEGKHADHTTTFRITNNGKFDVKVDFAIKSSYVPPAAEAPGKKPPTPLPPKKDAPAEIVSAFSVFPLSMELKVRCPGCVWQCSSKGWALMRSVHTA